MGAAAQASGLYRELLDRDQEFRLRELPDKRPFLCQPSGHETNSESRSAPGRGHLSLHRKRIVMGISEHLHAQKEESMLKRAADGQTAAALAVERLDQIDSSARVALERACQALSMLAWRTANWFYRDSLAKRLIVFDS